jgi:hypothetical protein
MPPYKTGTYRSPDTYIRQRLSERQVLELSGSGSVDDELWIILEYYSEVQSVGMELLKRSGISNSLVRKRLFNGLCKDRRSMTLPRVAALVFHVPL